MAIPLISAKESAEKQKNGAVIVDIRSASEYGRQHIAQSVCISIDEMKKGAKLPENADIIFSCLGGMRTKSYAAFLEQYATSNSQVYILEGGLNAWKKENLPVDGTHQHGLDLMRQVQIAAGGLILLGCLLGSLISPAFYYLSAFVGAGLMFAGITGFCGMARLLAQMPWNKS